LPREHQRRNKILHQMEVDCRKIFVVVEVRTSSSWSDKSENIPTIHSKNPKRRHATLKSKAIHQP